MKVTVAYSSEQFAKPISYIFDLMLSILGLEHEILSYSELTSKGLDNGSLLISYGHKAIKINSEYQIHIYQSELFSKDYKTLSSMPNLPLKRWNGLPIIYQGNGDIENLVTRNRNLIETNVDIVASSFFMLTRYEEILIDERDQYDRFPATASIAYKENFLTRPIVNDYIGLLRKWIDSLNLDIKFRTLWDGKDLAILLTHDVDSPWRYKWWRPPLKTIARAIANGKLFTDALRYTWDWCASSLRIKQDPGWNFDYILDIEHRYCLSSSFYFMTYGEGQYGNNYSIDDNRIISLIKKLENADHEVGFHGSFGSYNNYEKFSDEKRELDHFVSNKHYGGRQHYLRWETPVTWRILEKAGMLYDTTLCYADHEGFRCGICLPFRPFDVLEDRVMDIWELPLIVMDGTLRNYRNLPPEQSKEVIRALLDVVAERQGLFVMLWHNNSLYEADFPGWKRVYENAIKGCGSKAVFSGNGRDIIRHWVKNLEKNNS